MDPILLTTALTSLLPAGVDLVKTWFAKKNDGRPVPATADDYAKIVRADIDKLAALAQMEKSDGPTYPWVGAVRQLQRPPVVLAVLGVWAAMAVGVVDAPDEKFQLVSQLASSVFFYLFGERANFYMRRGA